MQLKQQLEESALILPHNVQVMMHAETLENTNWRILSNS